MSNDDTSGYTQTNIQRAKYSAKKIQVIKSPAMTWLTPAHSVTTKPLLPMALVCNSIHSNRLLLMFLTRVLEVGIGAPMALMLV